MACNKYQNGLIYSIKTDNGLYVGSTCDFARRRYLHKSKCFNENSDKYNLKVYKNIRENDGEYSIEIYKMFPCNSVDELRSEEENVRKHLNPNLNRYKCIRTKEDTREYYKNWKKTNTKGKAKRLEKITCECGVVVCRAGIAKHRKTQNHLKLMELKTDL